MSDDNKGDLISKRIACAVLGLLLVACSSSTRRLDEAPVLDLPSLRVKVVRYYEDMPWHYTGEIYTVQCATPQTRSMRPRTKTGEMGWFELERGGAIGSKSASEIAARIRDRYRIVKGYAIVMIDEGFRATIDGCRTVVHWNGWNLPESLVEPVTKPSYCKTAASECPWENFKGERSLHFSEIKVDPVQGHISMIVDSIAFKNNKRLAVSSTDGGRTWKVASIVNESAVQAHARDVRNARA